MVGIRFEIRKEKQNLFIHWRLFDSTFKYVDHVLVLQNKLTLVWLFMDLINKITLLSIVPIIC